MIIFSVDFLNNLDDLLHVDTALVSRKVCELVIMGGRNNDGFNFVRHNLVGVTEHVVRSWSPLCGNGLWQQCKNGDFAIACAGC